MEAVQEITGVKVVSLHHDISTVTAEGVILFTLAGSCPSRKCPLAVELIERYVSDQGTFGTGTATMVTYGLRIDRSSGHEADRGPVPSRR
jgi:hypothetical protein